MMPNHYQMYRSLRSKKVLEQACLYLDQGVRGLRFFDHAEREYLFKYKKVIVQELLQELKSKEGYKTKNAYAYFPPKSELCNRRMLCLHPKDHILRTAFVIVLSKYLEKDLLESCYANRRAKGDYSDKHLLADFADESWPNFCDWQKRCARRYNFMIRTDITSFYDSVSHQYFIDRIKELTGLPDNCGFITLFRRIQEVPIISYSHSQKTNGGLQLSQLKQGLVIGSICDGYFSNLYLHPIDVLMKEEGVEYGRYNDDMRIFGNSFEDVISALQMIQEKLLELGLNLNSSKTSKHEGQKSIEDMIHETQVQDYMEDEEEDLSNDDIKKNLDRPLNEKINFSYKGRIKNKDSKIFCKWLNYKYFRWKDWETIFIKDLIKIMTEYRGSSKSAAWLLVKAFYNKKSLKTVQKKAAKAILRHLKDKRVCPHSRYRIIHHLIHPARRDECLECLYNYTSEDELKKIFTENLSEKSFELNIVSLNGLSMLGSSNSELKSVVSKTTGGNISEPFLRCIRYLDQNFIT